MRNPRADRAQVDMVERALMERLATGPLSPEEIELQRDFFIGCIMMLARGIAEDGDHRLAVDIMCNTLVVLAHPENVIQREGNWRIAMMSGLTDDQYNEAMAL